MIRDWAIAIGMWMFLLAVNMISQIIETNDKIGGIYG